VFSYVDGAAAEAGRQAVQKAANEETTQGPFWGINRSVQEQITHIKTDSNVEHKMQLKCSATQP